MRIHSRIGALPALWLFLLPRAASAHDVPDDVRIHAFLKPSGARMQILIRVPVNAMIDTLFPLRDETGFLDIAPAERMLPDAARLWIADLLSIYERETPLPKPAVLQTRLSRETDPSFATFQEAAAHVAGPPLPPVALLTYDRAMLDVLLETPIHSDRSRFSLLPRFGRLGVRVTTTVQFLQPDGEARSFEYEGDPEMYRLNPAWAQSAARFLQTGFFHITDQIDHLLLLFCAALLFRRFSTLVRFVAAFTAAHSVVLIGAFFHPDFGAGWLAPLSAAVMAASIVYMALECIVDTAPPNPFPGTSVQTRWPLAIASGAFFGFGFWFFLKPVLQFGGAHGLVSVLAFNAGIEAGQCVALALLVPAVNLFFHFAMERTTGAIILAGLVAHMAWHRMVDRAYLLSRFEVAWPVFNRVSVPWILAAAILAGLIGVALRNRADPHPRAEG